MLRFGLFALNLYRGLTNLPSQAISLDNANREISNFGTEFFLDLHFARRTSAWFRLQYQVEQHPSIHFEYFVVVISFNRMYEMLDDSGHL